MGLTGSPEKPNSPERRTWWNILQSNKRGKPIERQPKSIKPLELPSNSDSVQVLSMPVVPTLGPTPAKAAKPPLEPPLAPAQHAYRAHASGLHRRPAALLKVPTLVDSPVNSPHLKRQRLRTPSTDLGARPNQPSAHAQSTMNVMSIDDVSGIEAQTKALRVDELAREPSDLVRTFDIFTHAHTPSCPYPPLYTHLPSSTTCPMTISHHRGRRDRSEWRSRRMRPPRRGMTRALR
jgi:hypothetical protein